VHKCFVQAVVLCQVEKAKEDMLNQLYSSVRLVFIDVLQFCNLFFLKSRILFGTLDSEVLHLHMTSNISTLLFIASSQSNEKIEQLIQEDQNVKRRRERYQKQSSLLSKLTRQLSIHDSRASIADPNWSSGATASGKLIIYCRKLFPYICSQNKLLVSFFTCTIFKMQRAAQGHRARANWVVMIGGLHLMHLQMDLQIIRGQVVQGLAVQAVAAAAIPVSHHRMVI
jgi:hypothetical protein